MKWFKPLVQFGYGAMLIAVSMMLYRPTLMLGRQIVTNGDEFHFSLPMLLGTGVLMSSAIFGFVYGAFQLILSIGSVVSLMLQYIESANKN